MKILLLANTLGGGGAERVLVNIANALAAKGYDITIRVLVDFGINRELLSSEVKYSFLFKKSFRGLNYLYMLPHSYIYNRVVGGEYDIVIPYLHGVLTRIVAYAPKTQKKIAFLHANMETSPFMLDLKKHNRVYKCFDEYNKIVSVSKSVQDSFVRSTGINDRRLVVKYNTFDVYDICKKAKESISIPLNFDLIQICAVGKLETVKGYIRLLRALKKLSNEGLEYSLIVVGEGCQRNELEQYIKNNSMESYVTLVGFDSNPYKYIANSNLFVCSSYSEGFSSVVAESLILGVPVLTTDCAGMSEMLGENNEYGVIVENSEEGLYSGLKKLLTNKDLLDYYTKKAKERSAFFEPDATVGAVEDLFREVMENDL